MRKFQNFWLLPLALFATATQAQSSNISGGAPQGGYIGTYRPDNGPVEHGAPSGGYIGRVPAPGGYTGQPPQTVLYDFSGICEHLSRDGNDLTATCQKDFVSMKYTNGLTSVWALHRNGIISFNGIQNASNAPTVHGELHVQRIIDHKTDGSADIVKPATGFCLNGMTATGWQMHCSATTQDQHLYNYDFRITGVTIKGQKSQS